jgi:exosortase
VGIRGDVAMFQAYSFIGLLAGLIWCWFGRAMLRRVLFPVVFLVFMAPTFPVFINQISFRLKTLAAIGSVSLAQALGVTVTRQGMDLHFPSGMMTIEGACSGLNSLIALMAMGALFAYLGSGSGWRRLLLFLCSVPIAVAANIVRISSLCVYAAFSTTERATGLFHDIGGFVLFGFALLAMALTKRILRC